MSAHDSISEYWDAYREQQAVASIRTVNPVPTYDTGAAGRANQAKQRWARNSPAKVFTGMERIRNFDTSKLLRTTEEQRDRISRRNENARLGKYEATERERA